MSRIVADAKSSDADFIVYSTTFCPYCVAAKRLFDAKGLTYHEINFDNEPDVRNEVVLKLVTEQCLSLSIIEAIIQCLLAVLMKLTAILGHEICSQILNITVRCLRYDFS